MTRSGTIGLALAAVAACSGGGPGTVAGDAYLDLDSGREVSLAGMPVHLVPDGEELDSALVRVCEGRDSAFARLGTGPADTAARRAATDRAWEERDRILAGRSVRVVTTGPSARFAADSVAPGRYRVWADTTLSGHRWTWLAPIRVEAGDTARVELNSATVDDNPLKCRW